MTRSLGMFIVFALGLAACASGGGSDEASDGAAEGPEATEEPEPAPADVDEDDAPAAEPAAEEVPPEPEELSYRSPSFFEAQGGEGIEAPLGNAPLPEGWTEVEYEFGGEAVSYEASDEPTDGFWAATEAGTAEYRTRLLVRTPPAEQFSGTVLIEWMNVTAGHDTTPDWGYLAEEIGRSGHAYVAVSVQAVGLLGRDGDFVEGGLVDTSGLISINPERYGDLIHPGDAWSFDIFTQAAAGTLASGLPDDLDVSTVIAMGESQSAAFMTTYVNAVHPLVGLFDAFLIHSRGGSAPAVQPDEGRIDGVLVRTDLDEPVLIFEAEGDLTVLSYADARQDDTDTVRTWEVAGASHADTYSITGPAGLPRNPEIGNIIGCPTLINDGPHHETLAAALRHLVAWGADGTPPPTSPRVQMIDGETIDRDDLGIALGGIRTPVVDAPLRVLSGDPGVDEGACVLFGQTLPFDDGVIATLYASEAEWLAAFDASAEAAIGNGWLLPEDAATMREEEIARAADLAPWGDS